MRDTLMGGFSSIQADTGLGALRRLDHEYSQLQGVFRRWPASGLRSITQIPALAEETYRQGLTVLISVLELLLAIPPSYKRGLETEVRALERVIRDLEGDNSQRGRLELRKGMLSTHRERLVLITRQELRAEEFLFRSSLSEAALNRTRIELAALRADSSEANVSAVSESLQRTIDQAREVLEEMRKLGF